MKFFKMAIILGVIILFSSLSLFSQNAKQISEIIASIQTKFVPDKRMGVFKIENKLKGKNLILTGESDNKEAVDALISELKNIKKINIDNKINLLPDTSLGANIYGLISVSVANIRREPDHDKELVSQALLGTIVKLLKKRDGFYLSQTPEGYLGWIESGSIVKGDKKFIEEWEKTKKVIFADIFGLINSEPDENSDPISDIVIACIVKYDSFIPGWIKVVTPKGLTGYIKEKSVMDFDEWIKSRKAEPESIIKTAKRFMGFPYLWGGNSSKGFDCSGYAKTIFWLNGIMLPRDANQQGLFGEEILPDTNYENVKPGDLMFFGSKRRDSKPRITHVGIYIGDKKFIHCSFFVQISSFDKESKQYDPYHSDRLAKVMRILK